MIANSSVALFVTPDPVVSPNLGLPTVFVLYLRMSLNSLYLIAK
nr:MAG TPA: hypothetical protein [Caudoviricetes sp.]